MRLAAVSRPDQKIHLTSTVDRGAPAPFPLSSAGQATDPPLFYAHLFSCAGANSLLR